MSATPEISQLSSPSSESDGPLEWVGPTVLSLVDREGSAAFSLEAVSAELDTDPGCLVLTLGDAADPLGVLTELVVDGLFHDVLLHPASGWQEYLVRVAHGLRSQILDHPAAWTVIAAGPPYAAWLRAPLRSRRCVNTFLEKLHQYGFSDGTGVVLYRAFCSFVVGYVSPELGGSTTSSDTGPPDRRPSALEDVSAYPRLVAAERELTADRTTDEFEEALECLLDQFVHDGPL